MASNMENVPMSWCHHEWPDITAAMTPFKYWSWGHSGCRRQSLQTQGPRINKVGPKRDGWHFADSIFKLIFFNDLLFKFHWNFVPKSPTTRSQKWFGNETGWILFSCRKKNILGFQKEFFPYTDCLHIHRYWTTTTLIYSWLTMIPRGRLIPSLYVDYSGTIMNDNTELDRLP